jgi:hypothetical protein
MVDAYFATHSFEGKPKAASYEASRFTSKISLTISGNKPSAGERTEVTQLKHESVVSATGKTAQSASTPALTNTSSISTVTGGRAFNLASPKVWNSLPISIRSSPSIASFKQHLKTFYFSSAFP